MAYGIIGTSQLGNADKPSGSIWGDCQAQELIDEGNGQFLSEDWFDAQLPTLASTAPGRFITMPGANDASTGTGYGYDVSTIHVINSSTGSTGGAGGGSYGTAFGTRPLGAITPGSGQKFWLEGRLGINAPSSANLRAIFFGIAANSTAGFTGSTANTGLTSNILNSTNALQTSTSLIGFWLGGQSTTAAAQATFDIVYQNGATVAGNAVSTIARDILNAATLSNPDPGNPNFTPATAPGSLTSTSFVKLGLRFDGQQYLYFYVNGAQVAKQQVDATFDTANPYGVVFANRASGSTVVSFARIDWIRVATKQY